MSNTAPKLEEKAPIMGMWFASLDAYVSGSLVGGWLYPLDYNSFDEFAEAIKRVTRNADEVAVHSYDNFLDCGEYPNHQDLYNLCHRINESGLDNDILLSYLNEYSYDETSIDQIEIAEDSFYGEWENFQEFSDDYVHQTITFPDDTMERYFDYKSFADDLSFDFHIIDLKNYNIAIFAKYY